MQTASAVVSLIEPYFHQAAQINSGLCNEGLLSFITNLNREIVYIT